MKMKGLIIAALSLLFLAVFTGEAFTFTNGAPSGRSGGAGESTCATSSCHVGTVNTGTGTILLTSDAVGGIYIPGNTYTITVRAEETGVVKFGFEVLSGYSASGNESVGTTAVINAVETQLLTSGVRKYITHRSGGISGTNFREWTFNWTAPAIGVGDVEFFGVTNSSNNNGGRTGDQIYTTSLVLTESPVSIEAAQEAPQLEVYPTIAEENVSLHLVNAGIDPLEVRVIDQQGRTLRVQGIQPVGSEVRESINVTNFAAGVYYLSVGGEGVQEIGKFVKR